MTASVIPFDKEGLAVTLVDHKTKEIVADEHGDELDLIVEDTQQLREALSCPLQIFDGEVAGVVVPVIKVAKRKLEQQVQATSGDIVSKEVHDAYTVVTEMLIWSEKFPKAVFDVAY